MDIERLISEHKTKTITERELRSVISGNYEEAFLVVGRLVGKGLLQPVIASRTNGRIPPLYNRYRISQQAEDYSEEIQRIKLLHPYLDHQAYFDDPGVFSKNKKIIEDLSDFLWRNMDSLNTPMSVNERSFSIWGKEKLLKEKYNMLRSILKFREWDLGMLNVYDTPEPFFEYIHQRKEDMDILIIENKDTWYTIRKLMLELDLNSILGNVYHGLLYGEGRKITRVSGRLAEYEKQLNRNGKNRFKYFGDLDIEGISIYLDLIRANKDTDIVLCRELYEQMLIESEKYELPSTSDKRLNAMDLESFLTVFPQKTRKRILDILRSGKYIPQEILNYRRFKEMMEAVSSGV
jgi:hypothetical protein